MFKKKKREKKINQVSRPHKVSDSSFVSLKVCFLTNLFGKYTFLINYETSNACANCEFCGNTKHAKW